MGSNAPPTDAGLEKLTVPQLKALCKEKGIPGYSKATKTILLEKLSHWQHSQLKGQSRRSEVAEHLETVPNSIAQTQPSKPPSPSSAVVPLLLVTRPSSQALENAHARQDPTTTMAIRVVPDLAPTRVDIIGYPHHHAGDRLGAGDQVHSRLSPVQRPGRTQPATIPSSASKRPHEITVEPVEPSFSKKQKTDAARAQADQRNLGAQAPTEALAIVSSNERVQPLLLLAEVPRTTKSHEDGQLWHSTMPKSKPFQALKVVGKSKIPVATQKNAFIPKIIAAPLPTDYALWYLDFPGEPFCQQLSLIPFPPSMAQRKHVPTLALVLSAITQDEIRTCARVSRLFRYSAYIAASHRLSRNFAGQRLRKTLEQYPAHITNLWPYLCFREREVAKRKRIYSRSFLAQVFKGFCDISPQLWASPDHEKQATIALRFLMTRLFFMVSVGYGIDRMDLTKGRVLDAQEVLPGEIWKVTFGSAAGVEESFVLEATCEVVGMPTASRPQEFQTTGRIRSDWSAYIHSRKVGEGLSLMEHLHWLNHEEYSRGISKVWLNRVAAEGKEGLAKVKIAERYVLACVMSNSISGKWMSSSEMERTFNGLPSDESGLHNNSQKMSLFIPVHHHVESVHFTTSKGHALHPALAVVQTPAREYFILKDIGMQVGCEEEGVSQVWMVLLHCETDGRAAVII